MTNSSTIIRTYKYRLYPTKAQIATLNEQIEIARQLYNYMLGYRQYLWQSSRRSIRYFDLSRFLSQSRNEDSEINPLQKLSLSMAREAVKRMDRAYMEFVKGNRGYPKFKGRVYFNSIECDAKDGASLKSDKIYWRGVGLIKTKWHRPLPTDSRLKHFIIIRRPSGWFVCIQIEMFKPPLKPSKNGDIGIDMGLRHALTLSNGEFIDSPKYLKQSLRRIRILQRRIARRKKGSNRRRKAVFQLQKEMEHIQNQRRDFWHKVTRQLVERFGLIVIEDLTLDFMLKNDHLARTAHDVSLAIFQELLTYKAEDECVEVLKVSAYNTSQACNNCGIIVPKSLDIRTHECPHCGFTTDRDVNAALNILCLGLDQALRR